MAFNRMKYILNTVCTAYRPGRLLVDGYISSFLRQTRTDTKLTIIHDGPDEETRFYVEDWIHRYGTGDQIVYLESETRTHQANKGLGYGHPNRAWGLNLTTEKYFRSDNLDNYLVPKAFELMLATIEDNNLDIVASDTLHNYACLLWGGPLYEVLRVEFRLNAIDVMSFIVRTDMAKKVGWNDYTTGGDGVFITELFRTFPNIRASKIPNVVFVHN